MMRLDAAIPHPQIGKPQSTSLNGAWTWGRVDVLHLCLLLAGFIVVLLLVPPVRSYPMSDDWAYAQSLERLLNLNYRPHDWTQPTSIGHIVWGVPFAVLLGTGFTALTVPTLVVSALCLAVFYVLLRQLQVGPRPALLGTALLGLNPLYIYLSYTYMTDLTFMLYVLAACVCLVRWAKGSSDLWLWLGSAGIALAYLTRQHGIVLVPAMLFYLWWSGRLNLRTVAALCIVPVAAVVGYMVWERTQPVPLVSRLVAETMSQALADPVALLWAQLQRSALVLSLVGFYVLPLIAYFRPRRPLLVVPLLLASLFFLIRSLSVYGTAQPAFGSLVDHGGLVLYDYSKAPIWTEHIWLLLSVAGSFVLALFVVRVGEEVWARRGTRTSGRGSKDADPAMIVYATGVLLGLLTFASPFLFDRYILPLLPVMLLFPLRRMSAAPDLLASVPQPRPRYSLAIGPLVPLALFSLLAMRDYKAHSDARWEAAQQPLALGAARNEIDAGFEWKGHYLFEPGVERVKSGSAADMAGAAYQAVLNPVYLIGDWPENGYSEIGSVEYDCWLCAGATRRVLVQERVEK